MDRLCVLRICLRVARSWIRACSFLLPLAAIALAGCRLERAPLAPSIAITRIPPTAPGGPEQLGVIEGKVEGAKAGQQIVLYVKNRIWWVQPFKSRPFTAIQSDATWQNKTHLGTEYMALLVDTAFHPQATMDTVPKPGNGVLAVVAVKGGAPAPVPAKVVHFSGYDWTVRSAESARGGEMNAYDPANAWVDEKGWLHLRMGMQNGRWTCAEVNLTRSLGYGTYRFVIQDSARLNASTVLGLYVMDEHREEDVPKELDIELSRWGRPEKQNAQYVVQPYYVPQNIVRFDVPKGELTHVIRWEPGVASFKTVRGTIARPGAKNIFEHVFTSGVPDAVAETVHIDLYDFFHSLSRTHIPQEVVIEKFEYLP